MRPSRHAAPRTILQTKKTRCLFQRITWKVCEEVTGRFPHCCSVHKGSVSGVFSTSPRNTHKITASHRDVTTQPRSIFKVKERLTVWKSVTRNQIRAINKFYSHYILCNVRVQDLLPGFKTSQFILLNRSFQPFGFMK